MMTAGSGRCSGVSDGAWGWNLVAKNLEILSDATDGAKVIGSGLVNVAGVGLQQLGNALIQISRR